MKKIAKIIAVVAVVLCSAMCLLAPQAAFAKMTINVGGEDIVIDDGGPNKPKDGDDAKQLLPIVATTIATIVGVLSVIMIVWAGFMYTTAAGDAGKVARAKMIIVYAVIGIIVAVASGAIALFVTSRAGL